MRILTLIVLVFNLCFWRESTMVTCSNGGQSWTSLQLIQIIHNAGARVPTQTYPNDPNVGVLKQLGFGQLTNFGKRAELGLGQQLRKRYGVFLGDYYHAEQLLALSRDDDVCLASTLTLLAGLFPPRGYQVWDSKIKWQPIPIHSTNKEVDVLLAPEVAIHSYDQLANSSTHKRYNKKNKDFYKYLTTQTGMTINDSNQVVLIKDSLQFAEENSLSIPLWAREATTREKIDEISKADFGMRTDSAQLQFFTSGILLYQLVNNMNNKVDKGSGQEARKINIFTTSDVVLGAALAQLGIHQLRPAPSSALLIELHRQPSTQQLTLEVFFKNGDEELVNVSLPFCPQQCTVDDVSQWLDHTTIQFHPGKFINLNVLADQLNFKNQTNDDDAMTVTVRITMTTIIVIVGMVILLIACCVCIWACCGKRSAYIRI